MRERENRYGGMPLRLKALLTLGLITGAFGLYEYYRSKAHAAPSCFPPNFVSREMDRAYTGVYFSPGELDSLPAIQTGRANFYGGGEALNALTSSGELFDPEAMTAASWFYPLGTTVRVTNIASGVSEIVRINDRGPDRIFYPDVIIDLTQGALRVLEPVADSIQVIVQPVCP